jgi:hypothetical protein
MSGANDLIGLILIMLVGGAALAALLVALVLLQPGVTGQCKIAIEKETRRSFWLGLVNLLFFLALAAFMMGASATFVPWLQAAMAVFAVAIVATLAMVALLGIGGMVQVLAERMGKAPTPLVGLIRSAGLLVGAAVAPFVGWWLFAPVILIFGLGAGILVLFRPKKIVKSK